MDEDLKRRLCSTALAASLAGALGLTSCEPSESEESIQTVYGPPAFFQDPATEEPVDMYGPPVEDADDLEEADGVDNNAAADTEGTTARISAADVRKASFDPSERPQLVYGPPNWR